MVKSTERDAWIALGSNEGASHRTLLAAFTDVSKLAETRERGRSQIWRTAAVGPDQPDYLNAVLRVSTTLHPLELLEALAGLERVHGRMSRARWGPRTLDLDLLLMGETLLDHPKLTLPHPRLHQRRFVLGPMCEIDGALRHPVLDRTLDELLQALP